MADRDRTAATRGPRTTEFWLTVLGVVGNLTLAFVGKVDGEIASGAIAAIIGLYAVGRGQAKRGG